MNKALPFLILLLSTVLLNAQNIRGRVISTEGEGISSAHIRIQGTTKGFLSDPNGYFTISEVNHGDILVFSHIKFDSYTVTADTKKDFLNIVMIPKTYNIKPVSIYSKPVICLMPDTPLFITDYEIWDDQIVITANKMRKSSQPRLIFMNMDGDIGASADIDRPVSLFKDPLNNIYYGSKEEAWQIFNFGDTVFFSQPFDAELFSEAQSHWVESIGDSVIFSYHYYRNQALGYFLKSNPSDSAHEWFTFVDEEAIDRMSWGGFFDNNEFDQRFAEKIVYKPVQVPMYFFEDSIVAFNFITKEIEFYTYEGEKIKSVEMQYSYKNKMEDEVYYDEVYKKFYGREIRNGKNALIEIDINSGLPGETYTFKGYPHIEKLKVYANELFFIYKDYSGDEYRRLYKSPLIKQSAGL
ncbi:MAG: carboxypeptidase-like regulatory domain-containing protein [Bacteroidales bacterium]|nr:carboxypeptidase-like regulatory domain-containing protein [Bacteroidales bacterium]